MRYWYMKREKKKKGLWFLALVLAIMCLMIFSSASSAEVSFTDGQYVKLGYGGTVPLVWEAKALTGVAEGKFWLLGSPLSVNTGYGATSAWENSNVREYLNETFLETHFSQEELAAGALTPYGESPVYDVTVPDIAAGGAQINIPSSSAGDSLVWILDVQEIQAIYNGTPDIHWNDTGRYTQRRSYSAGGPYRTRSVDSNDPLVIWSANPDGSFARDSIASPAFIRPVISPAPAVMLYKRGMGTTIAPYNLCYRWNVVPVIAASTGDSFITLSFPEAIGNNGAWPGAEAWKITDSNGTSYSITGTTGADNTMTLTIYPAVAENVTLKVKYAQGFDDASQGLNNSKGAILKAISPQNPFLHFGLPEISQEIFIAGNADEQRGDLRIVSDSTHYLTLGQPFILGLEAEGGAAPYSWSTQDTLPDGLRFSEDGILEGTPLASGSFNIIMEVSDSIGTETSKKFAFLVVEKETLAILTDTLPDARVGQPYSVSIRAAGGTKPYEWTIENLPAWLQFDSVSGLLSGTPAEAATHDIMVRVGDGEGNSESKLLRLSVEPHDGLDITTKNLPAAVSGQEYSASFEAAGGAAPYFFTLRRGASLPSGLTLDSAGTLSGTPVESGAYDFTVDVLDGNALQGSALYTMVILNEDSSKAIEFSVSEHEREKRLNLNFNLPKAFNGTDILSVEAMTSPDVYISSESSSVTQERNGAYKVTLTLNAAENALTGAGNWKNFLDKLTIEGISVRFGNASGETVLFKQPAAVKGMKRDKVQDEERGGDDSDEMEGCNALGLGLFSFLSLPLCLRSRKK